MSRRRAAQLVVGLGNPSRGDDAIGPELVRRLELVASHAIERGELEVLTDFQLQVEHVLDLQGRQRVYFVDASVAETSFSLSAVRAERDPSFTSHLLSPAALLHAYTEVLRAPPPPCFLLAVGGRHFELGAPLSEGARANLEAALAELLVKLERREPASLPP